MAKRLNQAPTPELRPRFRVFRGQEIALGPGKAELLHLIQETGSIRQAAAKMGMSYMRAWTLVQTMNHCFREPLVEAVRGGSTRGGTKLTREGKRVLQLYERLELESLAATATTRRQLATLLKRKSGGNVERSD